MKEIKIDFSKKSCTKACRDLGEMMAVNDTAQKITFEYDAENSDALYQVKLMLNINLIGSILWEIDNKCRDVVKYDKKYNSAEELAEEIRSEIREVRDLIE